MMFMEKWPSLLLAFRGAGLLTIVLVLRSAAAHAEPMPAWTFGGFGTAGLVQSSERQAAAAGHRHASVAAAVHLAAADGDLGQHHPHHRGGARERRQGHARRGARADGHL